MNKVKFVTGNYEPEPAVMKVELRQENDIVSILINGEVVAFFSNDNRALELMSINLKRQPQLNGIATDVSNGLNVIKVVGF